MANYQISYITINGIEVPVYIYREWRSDVRASLGSTKLILRLPFLFGKRQLLKQLENTKAWLEIKIQKSPALLRRFLIPDYQSGDKIKITNKEYSLSISTEGGKSKASLKYDNTIEIIIASHTSTQDRKETIQKLIRKIIAKDNLEKISARVHHYNDLHFGKEIKRISLRYNSSNWGSCSAKKNISLSTRILKAPEPVQDYVIIHELSHLVELNHSRRFWKIIENIDPNYMLKEKWLKEHGKYCHI